VVYYKNTPIYRCIKLFLKYLLKTLDNHLIWMYIIYAMRKKERQAIKAPRKPIQGHYGLEYALAHMGEDLSDVLKHLESEQRRNK